MAQLAVVFTMPLVAPPPSRPSGHLPASPSVTGQGPFLGGDILRSLLPLVELLQPIDHAKNLLPIGVVFDEIAERSTISTLQHLPEDLTDEIQTFFNAFHPCLELLHLFVIVHDSSSCGGGRACEGVQAGCAAT